MAFTFFFRDQHVLERVVEHCLMSMAGRNHPRVWVAGAATGQEPYTLAILFAERMGHFAFNNLRIEATDVERTGQFARIIEAGVYPQDELSRLPAGILEKYFQADGQPGTFRVIEKVRQRVTFRWHDLLSLAEIGQNYSLIVCKNVLLHFRPEERTEVLKMFHRALGRGGFFVTEQTQDLPAGVASLFEQVPEGRLFRKIETCACA